MSAEDADGVMNKLVLFVRLHHAAPIHMPAQFTVPATYCQTDGQTYKPSTALYPV